MKKHGFTSQQIGLYLFFLLLFVLHQALEFGNSSITFFDNYLDAFLLPLLLLPFLLFEKRLILKEDEHSFTIPLVFTYFLVLVIISEFIFPALSNRFTFDWWDVIAIGAGTILFHVLFNSRK